MKFLVFFVLSLVAVSLATGYSTESRVRRQDNSTSSSSNCTKNSGLVGVLEQLGNLLGNLLDNLLSLKLTPDTTKTLTDLLQQIQSLLNDLLGNNSDSSSNTTEKIEALLKDLLSSISEVLGSTLGSVQTSKWACTSPTGIAGSTLSKVLGLFTDILGSLGLGIGGDVVPNLARALLRLIDLLLASLRGNS